MQAARALSALLVLAFALAFALALASTASARHSFSGADPGWTYVSRISILREGIAWQRVQTWKWQDAVGVRRSPAAYHERRETSVPYLRWIVSLWNGRRDRAYRAYKILLRSRPAHFAGWSCITNGAYPGAAHEGNGYNGSFTGPLGMTTPWMGHYPPGRDWVHTPAVEVYRIAEAESAKRGFSYSWMVGQWPNTFPPCARFFA